MKLDQLVENLPVRERRGAGNPDITGLAYQIDRVGPGTVFCTWKGLKTDGHRFVPEALQRGASALIVEDFPEKSPDCPVLAVDSGRRALSVAASNFYGKPAAHLDMVGVTGTNGKTSTAFLLHYLLGRSGVECGLLGTVEYRAGARKLSASRTTPESADLQAFLAEMREAGCRAAVMEVSSHALELDRVFGIPFQVAVFTNLTQDHLDFHGTMENYFRAKEKLFTSLGPSSLAAINVDDAHGARLLHSVKNGVRVCSYALEAAADYRAAGLDCRADGTRFEFVTPAGSVRIQSPWIGRFNVCNMLAALAVMAARGVDIAQLAGWMKNAPPVPGRLQIVPHGGTFTVAVDYAHTDDAVRNVLQSVRPLCRGKLRILIGCGGDRDRGKRPLMARAACNLSDHAVFTSDNPRSEDPLAILREMEAGVPEFSNYKVVPDRAEAIAEVIGSASAGDIVILAGKGHETTQEANGVHTHFSDSEVAAKILRGGAL